MRLFVGGVACGVVVAALFAVFAGVATPPQVLRAVRPSRRGVLVSCPFGATTTHGKGSWRPSRLSRGVEVIADRMAALNSSLPLVVFVFESERQIVLPWCHGLRKLHKGTVDVVCFAPDVALPSGYGVSKVAALVHAPLDEVLWLDADVYPLVRLEDLFEDEGYVKTGALFWPDFYDNFRDKALVFLWARLGISRTRWPLARWDVRQGLDTGIYLFDRRRCAAAMSVLHDMALEYDTRWKRYSMGDKDLSHIAFPRAGAEFSLIPWTGVLGRFAGRKQTWKLSTQVKHDRLGNAVALHQLYRLDEHEANSQRNFGAFHWDAVGSAANASTFHFPEVCITVDLQSPGLFRPDKLRTAGEARRTLSVTQMSLTSAQLRRDVSDMAAEWLYTERVPYADME